ncbi:MAG: hypothetical protein L0154_17055, partial [Chloroflexi bacterium]|nr:hypothetical protein [Chloroflexota bacterium]
MEHFDVSDLTDLMEGIARGRYETHARHAPLVFQAVDSGDEVAIAALKTISRGLGDLACGVIRQLKLESEEFDVVMAGSFYKGSPLIAETMREVIHPVAPGATLVRLEAPPVVGSVMLGMEQGGVDFTLLRQPLIESASRLLAEKEGVVEGEE